jgi:hypothetical protein
MIYKPDAYGFVVKVSSVGMESCLFRGSCPSTGQSKRCWGDERLRADSDTAYERVSQRKVIATRWVEETFPSRGALKEDYDTIAHNTDMSFFPHLEMVTYRKLTYEFIEIFEDTLSTHRENCNVSFNLLGERRTLANLF